MLWFHITSAPPPWPSQHRSMQVSSPLLNITLSHSRATGDSLGHSRVWCRVFRTNIAQNHKLTNNFHKRNSKLWLQICFCTQCDYWKKSWGQVNLRNHEVNDSVCVCIVLLGWLALVMRHCIGLIVCVRANVLLRELKIACIYTTCACCSCCFLRIWEASVSYLLLEYLK